MVIRNHGSSDDRLTDARSDIAARVELHTHRMTEDGVMQMIHVPEGFDLPAGGEIVMERGGHHVMLMGLTRPLAEGDSFTLVLVFAQAGEVPVEVPVTAMPPARGGAGAQDMPGDDQGSGHGDDHGGHGGHGGHGDDHGGHGG
jgi:copper(I)-binding protein